MSSPTVPALCTSVTLAAWRSPFTKLHNSAKVYVDKHEATQKHVNGLAAMHLPLPDAELQHPECAGHNLEDRSCKLHPYKSSWLHWLSEGRPALKPIA